MNITLSIKQFQALEDLVTAAREQFDKHYYEGRLVTEKSGIVEWSYHKITLELPGEE